MPPLLGSRTGRAIIGINHYVRIPSFGIITLFVVQTQEEKKLHKGPRCTIFIDNPSLLVIHLKPTV